MRGPGQGEPKGSVVSAIFAELRKLLFGWAWDRVARREWCSKQQQSLRAPGHFVVWVRKDTLRWAEWGAGRGYFELERMDGLAYLRGLGA